MKAYIINSCGKCKCKLYNDNNLICYVPCLREPKNLKELIEAKLENRLFVENDYTTINAIYHKR